MPPKDAKIAQKKFNHGWAPMNADKTFYRGDSNDAERETASEFNH